MQQMKIAVINRGSSNGGLIHEIFNGGSKQRRFLLPVIGFLVMIALCLPVLLVYESADDGDKKLQQQRSKDARRAIRDGNKQQLQALLADTNAVSVRGDVSSSAAAAGVGGEEGDAHSNSDRGGGEKYDDVTNNKNMDPLATLLGPREATAVLPPYNTYLMKRKAKYQVWQILTLAIVLHLALEIDQEPNTWYESYSMQV